MIKTEKTDLIKTEGLGIIKIEGTKMLKLTVACRRCFAKTPKKIRKKLEKYPDTTAVVADRFKTGRYRTMFNCTKCTIEHYWLYSKRSAVGDFSNTSTSLVHSDGLQKHTFQCLFQPQCALEF
jgi:hypothetical protein